MKTLLNQGADPNIKNDHQQTPLIRLILGLSQYQKNNSMDATIQKGNALFDLLIQHCADVNLPCALAQTALHVAVKYGLDFMVERLLQQGANLHACDFLCNTPLIYATRGAFTLFNTPLTYAARETFAIEIHVTMIRRLLQAGADPNVMNTTGNSPLHFWVVTAAKNKQHLSVLQLFLEKGANINLQNEEKETPLFSTFLNDDGTMLEHLLMCGANPNAQNIKGDTLLHFMAAAKCQHLLTMATLLLQYGADPQIENYCQESPLWTAMDTKNQPFVQFLLPYQQNLNACNKQGTSLFDLAQGTPMDALLRKEIIRREKKILDSNSAFLAPALPSRIRL